ncbi:MAG: L,D-transpeptidase, partial [Coxiellaceae bacterium]|nr:L,D-transpeptidase [Coxiellaceae bacterium]
MKFTLLSISLLALLGMTLSLPAQANSKYYGAHLCGYSGFKCIQVKRGDTWAKLFPDKRKREIVKRLNRTNVALRHRSWIIVPTNLDSINHMDMSPFPDRIEATGKRTI